MADKQKTKVFVYLDPDNAEWLDMAVASLKRSRRRTSRSELVDAAVSLLKEKSSQEIARLIKT